MSSLYHWVVGHLEGIIDGCIKGGEACLLNLPHQQEIVLFVGKALFSRQWHVVDGLAWHCWVDVHRDVAGIAG
jgi:hypothetical protein